MKNLKIRLDLGKLGTTTMTFPNVKYTINGNLLRVRNRETNQNILIVPTDRVVYMHDADLFKEHK